MINGNEKQRSKFSPSAETDGMAPDTGRKIILLNVNVQPY